MSGNGRLASSRRGSPGCSTSDAPNACRRSPPSHGRSAGRGEGRVACPPADVRGARRPCPTPIAHRNISFCALSEERCGMTISVCVPPPAGLRSPWLDPALLAGQLAPSSLVGYRRDVARYLHFCGAEHPVSAAASLARWRTVMAQETRLAPATINRRLAAVKRVVTEAASQGYTDGTVAEAFRRVTGVQAKALKDRITMLIRPRLTPGQMRQLCEAPDRRTLLGWRDRAFLHTLASSGCRVSEVVTLTPPQLASREGSFFLEIVGKNQTTARLAPLSSEAVNAIEAWLAR